MTTGNPFHAESQLAALGKRAADLLEADTGSRPVHEDHRAISSVFALFEAAGKRRRELEEEVAHLKARREEMEVELAEARAASCRRDIS